MKTNLKTHELIGLLMIFLSGILIGIGLFATFWLAIRPFFITGSTLITVKEFLIFPFFYGLGFVMWAMGHIEIKEAKPGKRKNV